MQSVAESQVESPEVPAEGEEPPVRKGLTFGYFALHCFLPIFIGGMIYILWRVEDLYMFAWADAIGLSTLVATLREWAAPMRGYVPEFVLFSIPDGTWVYACTAFFTRMWPDGPLPIRLSWIGIGGALAIGGELGQLVGLVPGTFDIVDVLMYAGAAALAFWLGNR